MSQDSRECCSNQDVSDIACRPVEDGPILVVDPDSKFIVIHSVQGLLKIVPVSME